MMAQIQVIGGLAVTSLMVTNIKESCDREFDLITAKFLNGSGYASRKVKPLDRRSLLVLESATAKREMEEIGVLCGDQFIRLKARKNHGLAVGDAITFDGVP